MGRIHMAVVFASVLLVACATEQMDRAGLEENGSTQLEPAMRSGEPRSERAPFAEHLPVPSTLPELRAHVLGLSKRGYPYALAAARTALLRVVPVLKAPRASLVVACLAAAETVVNCPCRKHELELRQAGSRLSVLLDFERDQTSLGPFRGAVGRESIGPADLASQLVTEGCIGVVEASLGASFEKGSLLASFAVSRAVEALSLSEPVVELDCDGPNSIAVSSLAVERIYTSIREKLLVRGP